MAKCWFLTPQNDNISIVNMIPNIPNLCEILNCSENYLFFKQFEIRNKNEGKIYTVAFNGDATEFNSCATNYFSKLKVQHLCTYKSVQLFRSTKILVGKFVVFVEKVDRTTVDKTPTFDMLDALDRTRTADEESDEEYGEECGEDSDEEPEFIDVDLSDNEFITEFNRHEIYDMIV